MPVRRWKTRLMVPMAILASSVLLLAYAARATFQSAIGVWVLPVVSKPLASGESGESTPASGQGTGAAIAQAPGWVEADPFPITVPALAEGVIKEVLIVEGQRVEAGQIIVKMIDEDAKLAMAAAAAELAVDEADLARAKADLEYQRVNYKRLIRLHENENAPEIEWANAKRDHDQAEAQVASFAAKVVKHRVVCDQAKLTLSRMEVKSPVAGIVMERLVEPGTRISMTNISSGERMGAVARLYDPQKLQVRVDVPLVDAAKVDVGSRAEIVTEAAGEVVFHGTVSRLVHEANIQRNTVQVKVAIEDPSATLKPEMLTRVRFYSRARKVPSSQPTAGASSAAVAMRLFAPRAAMFNISGDRADAWIVEQSKTGTVAAVRHLTVIGPEHDGYCLIAGEIQPGARLIVDPLASLKAGARVRVLGEKATTESQR
jgi:RND family efflux transporter MFP subunit